MLRVLEVDKEESVGREKYFYKPTLKWKARLRKRQGRNVDKNVPIRCEPWFVLLSKHTGIVYSNNSGRNVFREREREFGIIKNPM